MYYQDGRHKLTADELQHYCGSFVRLTPLQYVTRERINIHGIRVRAVDAYKHNFCVLKCRKPTRKYSKKIAEKPGKKTGKSNHNIHEKSAKSHEISNKNVFTEFVIDDRVLRINLRTNCLNLIVTKDLFTARRRYNKDALMHSNDELNKSIIKSKENGRQSPVSAAAGKTVSFNNTYYITPIPPRHSSLTPPQQNSYENTFKEYLKKMNGPEPQKTVSVTETNTGGTSTPETLPTTPELTSTQPSTLQSTLGTPETPSNPNTTDHQEKLPEDDNEDDMEVEMLEDEPPRRGRGRPRGSGRLKQYVPRPPPRDPNTPPKRRGWPLGLSRKKFTTYKNVHRPYGEPSPPQGPRRGPGRPRKIIAFGFQTIVTDIKSVNLPSELWSAHVSVTSKRSQVCFTRVVQNKSNAIPVECDRSVKFNGTVKYLVRINNRDVALIAAPPAVNSLRDIEVLLNIVNDIPQNDPVLEYFNR